MLMIKYIIENRFCTEYNIFLRYRNVFYLIRNTKHKGTKAFVKIISLLEPVVIEQ